MYVRLALVLTKWRRKRVRLGRSALSSGGNLSEQMLDPLIHVAFSQELFLRFHIQVQGERDDVGKQAERNICCKQLIELVVRNR
jgi:hypothetical protein